MKAAIVAVTCDLPARALVLNMRQFNGKHGCHLCEDEGVNYPSLPMLRYWPYNSIQILRSRESILKNCFEATESEIVSFPQ